MGRLTVEATIESLQDLWLVERGELQPEQVRRVEIPDASVDTGATALALPMRLVEALGLEKAFEKQSMSSRGLGTVNIYGPVRLTVQGRQCHVDVVGLPDEVPALIGQLALEGMDWVVDFQQQRLIGNPAHGGEEMLEMF